nr:hypothetical protein CFP56_11860 [Quercus suber]
MGSVGIKVSWTGTVASRGGGGVEVKVRGEEGGGGWAEREKGQASEQKLILSAHSTADGVMLAAIVGEHGCPRQQPYTQQPDVMPHRTLRLERCRRDVPCCSDYIVHHAGQPHPERPGGEVVDDCSRWCQQARGSIARLVLQPGGYVVAVNTRLCIDKYAEPAVDVDALGDIMSSVTSDLHCHTVPFAVSTLRVRQVIR